LLFQFMCPCGAHPKGLHPDPSAKGLFQFMCPCGAHHVSSLYIAQVKNFNSCAPTGHITIDKLKSFLKGLFQFMCPYGAHHFESDDLTQNRISIHVPLRGTSCLSL